MVIVNQLLIDSLKDSIKGTYKRNIYTIFHIILDKAEKILYDDGQGAIQIRQLEWPPTAVSKASNLNIVED